MTKDNNLLGNSTSRASAHAVRPAAGEVTFDIDANGILIVKAVEKSKSKGKGTSNNIRIKNEKGRPSKD